jgi:peptidoglycan hydrolase-like protein with peptidoglycan-binding domain
VELKKMHNSILKVKNILPILIFLTFFSTASADNYGAVLYGSYLYSASDTNNPTVTAFTIPATSTSLVVSVSSFTATDNILVTGYLLTETSTAPSAGLETWVTPAPTSYTFATTGSKTLYAWAKDAAGNVSSSLNDGVVITLIDDNIKPIVTSFSVPSTYTSLVVPITIFTATDENGVTGYIITESSLAPFTNDSGWTSSYPTNYTFLSEGEKILYAWTKDATGNVSISLNDDVVITLPKSSSGSFGYYRYPIVSNTINNINSDVSLIKKVLKYGTTNLDVKTLQIYLNTHNFPIALTGPGSLNNETNFFGSLTKKALIKFQLANGLIGDGIFGPKTMIIVNKLTPTIVDLGANIPNISSISILKLGSSGNDVIELQKFLKVKGYFKLEPTGNFGPLTRDAVKKFQVANGLVGDGIVGEMTRVLFK